MKVRNAQPGDAEAIARVQVDAWHTNYRGLMPEDVLESYTFEARAERWRHILAHREPRRPCLVAGPGEGGEEVVGFACGGPCRQEALDYEGELYALYVHPDAQGRGVGRALFREMSRTLVAEGFRDMMLHVLSGNARARRFYAALGGEQLTEVPHPVGGHELRAVGYGWRDLAAVAR